MRLEETEQDYDENAQPEVGDTMNSLHLNNYPNMAHLPPKGQPPVTILNSLSTINNSVIQTITATVGWWCITYELWKSNFSRHNNDRASVVFNTGLSSFNRG